MTWRNSTFVILLGLAIAACSRPSNDIDSTKDLALTTTDGVRLTATLYPVSHPKPPGLVLVHALGSDRRSWQSFGTRAQREGMASIAVDLRGCGDNSNQNGAHLNSGAFTTADWLKTLEDIDAAKRALLESGVDPDNVAVAGAGLGANLALRYAVDHLDMQAIVMLSPGLDDHGINAGADIVALGKRPVLLMTSDGDSYSDSSSHTLKETAVGQCELREYTGASHGTDILDAIDTAKDQIILWLSPIIGPAKNSKPKTR